METTTVVLQNEQGEVQLFSDGNKAGKMDMSGIGEQLTGYQPEVDQEYEGQGLAKVLLQ